jgi:hypothetical protein
VVPALDLKAGIYPNPVSQSFSLEYVLPSSGRVVISLLSAEGKPLGTLFNGIQAGGRKQMTFNSPNLNGKTRPGGIYFVKIQTPSGYSTVRMIKAL